MNSTKGQIQVRRKQQGLTLIELVVVLAILVALAGLIIGNFPSLFRKATRAVGANSIQDISRAVQFQATVRNNFGSDYDNLMSGAALYTYLASGTAGVLGGQVTAGTLASIVEAQALTDLGLSRVISPLAVTDNITWEAFGPTAGTLNVANAMPVCTVNTNVAHALFNNQAVDNDKYVLFGVGSRCTLVGAGQSLLEAPTRSSAVSGNDAKSTYQRYGVVFLIRDNGTGKQATFAGAVGLESSGLTRTDSELQDYNNN